jgi:S-adenosylmethionine:tRNA ribosyltransferase-isomerase
MYQKKNIFSLSAYDYELPKELIAQKPTDPADNCKLLIFNRKNNQVIDEIFYNLPNYLN